MWIPIALATAVAMELWAAFAHGVLWHGPMWPLHASHHPAPGQHARGLGWNDLLSASHAPLAAGLIVHGAVSTAPIATLTFGIGVGMTAFGVGYAIVHDGFVHGRLPLAFLRKVPYFQRIRRAHLVHHATNGPPYGFFLARVPLTDDRRRRSAPPAAPPAT